MTTYRKNEPYDVVNRPRHYNVHESGIECIDFARWFPFSLGNAIKYIWRAGEKDDALVDLRKAEWYLSDAMKHSEDLIVSKQAYNSHVLNNLSKVSQAFSEHLSRCIVLIVEAMQPAAELRLRQVLLELALEALKNEIQRRTPAG